MESETGAPELATKRETNRLRTRHKISQSSRRLFTTHGFKATTIDQIAEEAGLSRRTFFRYFSTKEAVVFSENEGRLDSFIAMLEKETDPHHLFSGLDACVLLMARIFESAKADQLLQHRLIASAPALQAYELRIDFLWEQRLAQTWLKQLGDDASDESVLHVRAAAGAAMGMIRAVLHHWYEGECRGDLIAYATEGLARFHSGQNFQPTP